MVDIRPLHVGTVNEIAVSTPKTNPPNAHIFIVRERNNAIVALLARDAMDGCRLLRVDRPHDQPYIPGVDFEDPCHGSLYTLSGTCIGGPCHKALDQYPVRVVGNDANIDLTRLIPGGPSAPAAVGNAAAYLSTMGPATSAAYYQVSSRRTAVFVLSQGDVVAANTSGYAVVLRGNFTDEDAGGTSGKPKKGHFVYAFVDKASGEIQDNGIGNTQPDLKPLGRAIRFSCCG